MLHDPIRLLNFLRAFPQAILHVEFDQLGSLAEADIKNRTAAHYYRVYVIREDWQPAEIQNVTVALANLLRLGPCGKHNTCIVLQGDGGAWRKIGDILRREGFPNPLYKDTQRYGFPIG